jgi:hypothetical protein
MINKIIKNRLDNFFNLNKIVVQIFLILNS